MKRLLVFVFAVTLLGSCGNNEKLEEAKAMREEAQCKTEFAELQMNQINTKLLLKSKGFEKELEEFENIWTNDSTITCDELYAKWDEVSSLAFE